MALTSIVFEHDYPPYRAGDLAGFQFAKAVDLVNSKAGKIPSQLAHMASDKEKSALGKPAAKKAVEPLRSVTIVAENLPGYSPGMQAGFPPKTAKAMVDAQLATWAGEAAAEPAPPKSSFNARAHLLAGLEDLKGDHLARACTRFLGEDHGKTADPKKRRLLREALEHKTVGGYKSKKKAVTEPALTT